MKLRFRGNSLRLRVNRGEVELLARGNALKEHVFFPDLASMSYVLAASMDSAGAASFDGRVILVSAPRSSIAEWASGDKIGIYFEVPADGTVLKVAIEKDLECTDGRPEERDPDAFPRAKPC